MKTRFFDFKSWNKRAKTLGWVHVHGHFVVVDCSESGECLGEWDSITNIGWILEGKV